MTRGKRNSQTNKSQTRPAFTKAHLELAQKLTAGTAQVLPSVESLAERIAKAESEGRDLRVKFGMDPTAPDVHLGHLVAMQGLRAWQDAGHTVVLIIGDYTARVGDPTGKSSTRPMLSPEAIEDNAKTYQDQVFKILDPAKTEVRKNSEWLSKMTPEQMFALMKEATVAQMLERDDFQKRYQSGEAISMLELLYPLLQGHDSREIEADVEVGGTDQLFNLGMGRQLQNAAKTDAQIVITWPLLVGTDGSKKMSKSLGNYIGVETDPNEAFGRAMSIPDEAMPMWMKYATGWTVEQAEAKAKRVEDGFLHPRDAKMGIAAAIVERLHGKQAALDARADWDKRFRKNQVPTDMPEVQLSTNENGKVFLPQLLMDGLGVESRAQARRLLKDGAVKLDGKVINDKHLEADPSTLEGRVLQVGKRKWAKLSR